jgi:hypothetical protein
MRCHFPKPALTSLEPSYYALLNPIVFSKFDDYWPSGDSILELLRIVNPVLDINFISFITILCLIILH